MGFFWGLGVERVSAGSGPGFEALYRVEEGCPEIQKVSGALGFSLESFRVVVLNCRFRG